MLISRLAWSVVDLDIWHEMALIRASLEAHRLLSVDVFAFGPKLPVAVDHEWGAGVIAYFLAMNFGAAGILLFRYLVAASIGVFVTLTARKFVLCFPAIRNKIFVACGLVLICFLPKK